MSRSKRNWDHLVDSRGNYKDLNGGGGKGIAGFEKGDQGQKGEKGFGDKGSKGNQGNIGEKGLQGIPGTGAKGDKGEKGAAKQILEFKGTVPNDGYLSGIVGPETGDVWLAQDTSILWVWNGSNWIELSTVTAPLKGEVGPKGDKGEAGTKGEIGGKGSVGDKGDKGNQGDKGVKGDVGSKGDKGENGSKGSKGEGDKGGQGDKGTKGETGGAAPLFEYQGEIADVGSLPLAAAENAGHVYYVTDVDKYVVSDGVRWRNMDAPGLTPDLQQVTDSGSTTDKNIQVGSLIKMDDGLDLYNGGPHELEAREGEATDWDAWIAHAAAENSDWFGVTYDNGKFVAVAYDGTNRVMTSVDGETWTAHAAAEANNWYGVTYGNGKFVAVASSGTNRVMTSPDGETWTAHAATEANNWQSVTYGNGKFVAVARDGTNRVMTSVDGETWTAHAAAEDNSWTSVTYGNGKFVDVAKSGANRVMTSVDGEVWEAHAAAEANTWRSVTYGNGKFVAVANNGTNRVMTLDAIDTPAGLYFDDQLVATRQNIAPLIDAVNSKASVLSIIHDYYPQGTISKQSQFNTWTINAIYRIIDDLQAIFEGRDPD